MFGMFKKQKSNQGTTPKINFFDIGCSQDFDLRWIGLANEMNYVGCDPDEAECERLSKNPPANFHSYRYLPYAVSKESAERTVYLTKSPPCSSLLVPNNDFLNRFVFGELFHVEKEQLVTTVAFDALVHEFGYMPDVLKVDIQGAELELLDGFRDICSRALIIDLDVGFYRNYHEESVFWEVSRWMEANGFMLMDLDVNRVRRWAGNHNLSAFHDYLLNDTTNQKCQPLWGSSIWVKDLLGPVQNEKPADLEKMITLCRFLKFFDYAQELEDKIK